MKYPITADRLKEAMLDKHMIAQDLADRSGVSKYSISQYVNGSHCPSNISAGKLAEVLGVNPMWLMGFDVPKGPVDPDLQRLQSYYALLNLEGKKRLLEAAADYTEVKKYIE